MIDDFYIFPTGNRARISTNLLNQLSWRDSKPTVFVGLFRAIGELLICPRDLTTEEGEHPFQPVLGRLQGPDAGEPIPLESVPEPRFLLAEQQIFEFAGSWSKPESQLTLKLGKRAIDRLEWNADATSTPVAITWGAILIVLARGSYNQALERGIWP